MGISEITSRDAIIAAIEECKSRGRAVFLEKYGFGPATLYCIRFKGRKYDSKAIVGVAYGFQFPERGALSSGDFSGGKNTVVPLLERLGFEVVAC